MIIVRIIVRLIVSVVVRFKRKLKLDLGWSVMDSLSAREIELMLGIFPLKRSS
jgi:hypothetical protein